MYQTTSRLSLLTGKWLLTFVSIAGLAVSSDAVTTFTVSGQVRVRAEVDRKSFADSLTTREYSFLRSRIGIDALIDSATRAVVVLQDSRQIGGLTTSGAQISGVPGNARNTDLHQAFLEIRQLWRKGPALKAGRMEVNYGNQRVFGSGDWGNVVRSFEGVMLSRSKSYYKGDLFWFKRAEIDNVVANKDFDLFGLYAQFPDISTDLFLLYELNADRARDSLGNPLLADRLLQRVSFGLYHKRSRGALDWEANLVLQRGTQVKSAASVATEFDLAAWLVTAEAGVTLPGPAKARFALGADLASGDDNAADGEINSYDNLYYTGHKFRGFMDYFVASNPEGLYDLYFRSSLNPQKNWMISLDLHTFSTAEPYSNLSGTGTTRSVGFEADLTASTKRFSGTVLTAGLSLFDPDESFARRALHRNGLWGYLSLMVQFAQ